MLRRPRRCVGYYSNGSPTPLPAPVDGVVLGGTGLDAEMGHPYTVEQGRAGPDVSAVSLTLTDGTTVTTTVGHGYFVAWWPGTATPTSVRFRTPRGVIERPVGDVNSPGGQTPYR